VKRFCGILFNTAAAISLLLFAGAMVLWAQSYDTGLYGVVRRDFPDRFTTEYVGWRTKSGGFAVWREVRAFRNTSDWHFGLSNMRGPGYPAIILYTAASPSPPKPLLERLGFSYSRSNLYTWANCVEWQTEWRVSAPAWFVVLITLCLPVACIWRGRRQLRERERREKGYCVHCGYDLRATPQRCPECGRIACATFNEPSENA